jgi:hypothetical protein
MLWPVLVWGDAVVCVTVCGRMRDFRQGSYAGDFGRSGGRARSIDALCAQVIFWRVYV